MLNICTLCNEINPSKTGGSVKTKQSPQLGQQFVVPNASTFRKSAENITKVQILWEGCKIWKNICTYLPSVEITYYTNVGSAHEV